MESSISNDDLTIAYQLGVEDMRSRLHKQADEIERLRKENQQLRDALTYIQCKAHDTLRPIPFQDEE